MQSHYPEKKLNIIGGGIVGAFEALLAYLDAKEKDEKIRITIHEKNAEITQTTAAHIVPTLSPAEIIGLFSYIKDEDWDKSFENGGMRITDVEGLNENPAAIEFIKQVCANAQDIDGRVKRKNVLLELGKISMNLWQRLYDHPDLKPILEKSNFVPCTSPGVNGEAPGYRVILYYNLQHANQYATGRMEMYQKLGYLDCRLLPPQEALIKNPFLSEFCDRYTQKDELNNLQWKDAAALWCPGGCIDAKTFLSELYDYLKEKMGTYVNEAGKEKPCFQLRLNSKVTSVTYGEESIDGTRTIHRLGFFDRKPSQNKHLYSDSNYVFCPGESVGTLKKLGFIEPAYAGFAGASLILEIPIPEGKESLYEQFKHHMEVKNEGFGMAWQARIQNGKIFIGVGGTRAFYGEEIPNNDQAFARNKHLGQLNTIYDLFPSLIASVLKNKSQRTKLTELDLVQLENDGFATRWVGIRAATYDEFPTLGRLHSSENKEIKNARCTTHLGSGGVSFGPGAVAASRQSLEGRHETNRFFNTFFEEVLNCGSSKRGMAFGFNT